jgi:hypothetical protein
MLLLTIYPKSAIFNLHSAIRNSASDFSAFKGKTDNSLMLSTANGLPIAEQKLTEHCLHENCRLS